MHDDIRAGIARFEAMVGLCDYSDPDDPGQTARDKEKYGKEYALPQTAGGVPISSPAKAIRFLVEICGHSYEEALAGVIADMREQPRGAAALNLDAGGEARTIRHSGGNIIENLFDLKVVRLAYPDDERLIEFNWAVTRSLVEQRTDSPLKQQE